MTALLTALRQSSFCVLITAVVPPWPSSAPQTQSEPFRFSAAHADDVTVGGSLVEADWPRSQQPYCRETQSLRVSARCLKNRQGTINSPVKGNGGRRDERCETASTWEELQRVRSNLSHRKWGKGLSVLDGLVERTKDDSLCSVFHRGELFFWN